MFSLDRSPDDPPVRALLSAATKGFTDMLDTVMKPNSNASALCHPGGVQTIKPGTSALVIAMDVSGSDAVLSLETDESYTVDVVQKPCAWRKKFVNCPIIEILIIWMSWLLHMPR